MKQLEFYRKYKATQPRFGNPIFSRGSWWRIGLVSVAAILIGPLILYKHQRAIPFSLYHYLKLSEYFVFSVVPFVSFLIWVNWREFAKRKTGYGWVGKFEVVGKRSRFVFNFLLLAPGKGNQLKVNRELFVKTRIGDFLLIHRDALGRIEKVSTIKNFSSRLSRVEPRRLTIS